MSEDRTTHNLLTGKQRVGALDFLRFVAVLLVLLRHAAVPAAEEPFFDLFSMLRQGGWIGVDLFFTISGFLIANLFYREITLHGSVRPLRFLLRRAFKIYPLFWVFIVFTLIGRHFEGSPVGTKQLLTELFFLQNYYLGHWPVGLWAHTWSLAAEEHFYLLIAFLFFLAAWRRRIPSFGVWLLPVVACGWILLCPVFRFSAYADRGYNDFLQLFPTHVRLDGFFFGVLLAHGMNCGWRWLNWNRLIAVAAILVGIGGLIPNFLLPMGEVRYISTLGLSVNAFSTAIIIRALLILWSSEGNWKLGFFCFLGRHSYGVYLWHLPVLTWGTQLVFGLVNPLIGWNFGLYCFQWLLLCFGVGVSMSMLVERPFLRLRDRLFPSRSISRVFERVKIE